VGGKKASPGGHVQGRRFVIAVASCQPAKVEAVEVAFSQVFGDVDVRGVAVDSGTTQPRSDHDTHVGAKRRAALAKEAVPSADWWVGIEGGVEEVGDELMVMAWVVIEDGSSTASSRSASFALPRSIARRVKRGEPLGLSTRYVGRGTDWRRSGIVGALSDERVTRVGLYVQPVLLALLPFLPPWSSISENVRDA